MTREEHLQWCKDRALKYVEAGDCMQAFTSMGSDLDKHPETANHKGLQIGLGLLMIGELRTAQEMKRFIEGFN